MLVKKYGNRRLYDTAQSRYITLEELADLIRRGEGDEVRVVSAKDGEDLTTATLAQIIVESRGAARLLPVPILVQMIRMGDHALAEFLGQYVTWALEVYLQTKKGVRAMAPLAPFLVPGVGRARILKPRSRRVAVDTAEAAESAAAESPASSSPAAGGPPAARPRTTEDELAALRRELEELKATVKKRRRPARR